MSAEASTRPNREPAHRWLTVYSTRWCPACRRVKHWLEQKGVSATHIDIEVDAEAAQRVEAWTGGYRSVPTVILRQVLIQPPLASLRSVLGSADDILVCRAYVAGEREPSRSLLAWLGEIGVPLEIRDVDVDPAAARIAKEWAAGALLAPVVDLTVRLTEPRTEVLASALGL